MSENTESTTKPEVVQSPVAEQPVAQPAPVAADKTPEAAQAAPSASTDEISKSNLAFIKMRQEKKEAKRRIAELEAKLAAASKPAEPEATPAAAAAEPRVIQAAPQAEPENAEKTALESLARDKDLSGISGGMVEVMDLLDGDTRLTRIFAIDPSLAVREAKAMYLAKIGVSTRPSSAPVASPPAGGVRAASKDLTALFAALDKVNPGTKAYNDLVDQINKARQV